ncbi:hypothetical protein ACQPW3_41450 [Actinosynnema sp. CA-248983]
MLDEEDTVAAWVIDLPDAGVIAIFSDGTSTHTADDVERARDFVCRAEGIDGELLALKVHWL